MKKFYVNVQGGEGLNIGLASFISYIKEKGDDNGNKDYQFFVCSPYHDIFSSCPYVDGVYNPQEVRDFIFDSKYNDGELVLHRLYDIDGFVKKHMNYSQAWAHLMNIPFTDTENGTKVKSVLEPLNKYPGLQQNINQVLEVVKDNGFDDFVIMQFTGGQSALVNVPVVDGKPDWSKVPYDYEHEPLKRHYPNDLAQKFVDLFAKKHPKTAILLYQLPNEPRPNSSNLIVATMPYLAFYELSKKARGTISIDSSLQHLVAGVTKSVVIWAHSSPKAFGYSYNKNIEQKCHTDDLLYFSMLGPSGAKVSYIEPNELLKEVDNYIFKETKNNEQPGK